MEQAPRLGLWPGLCLTIVVYALNMFGDAVRDLLDPRLRGGRGKLWHRGKTQTRSPAAWRSRCFRIATELALTWRSHAPDIDRHRAATAPEMHQGDRISR